MLDLRGNPGGLLNVAVNVAGRFVDSGLIVSTRGRAQGQTQLLAAGGRARWRMPLYVLVDHDSASASEILAGALQDHQRATIVGARTYGKGSVQSIFSLRSAPAGLKLTTAKFYSPRNRPYSEQGVQPDISIVPRSAAKPADENAEIREEANYGDPAIDPVLAAAIRTAKEPKPAAPLSQTPRTPFESMPPAQHGSIVPSKVPDPGWPRSCSSADEPGIWNRESGRPPDYRGPRRNDR